MTRRSIDGSSHDVRRDRAGTHAQPVVRELLKGAGIAAQVVHAIILRETKTRFGQYRFGYLWALVDPMIVILTFLGFWLIIGRAPPPGMDLFGMLCTGLLPYRVFATCSNYVADAVNGNRALLFYPRVMPLDLVIARFLFEVVTGCTVFLLLMGAHALYLQKIEVHNPINVIGGMWLAALLGTGVGLVFCALGTMSNTVDLARGPILRPLFWVSGIFFTANMVPANVRKYMLYNPVLHCTELVRSGWFPAYSDQYVEWDYLGNWVLAVVVTGLILERYVRPRIELS